MNYLKFILRVLVHLGKTIAYGWVLSLINIVKRLCRSIKAFHEIEKLPHNDQDKFVDPCASFTHPAYHRPDPCIYSQYFLMKLSLPVTWDNPDITLKLGGVVVPKHNLLPGTTYEIDARIWNNSFDAPVIGLRVDFSYLSFGAATVSNPVGTTYIDLGVKGGANCPSIATMLWTTPPVPGHYCIQVNLLWADDANPDNNLGQNNIDVVPAHSPANFSFRLRNDTDTTNNYAFQVDTYAIPTLPDCPPTLSAPDTTVFAERLKRIQAIHNRANFPIPPGWTVEIVPSEISLSPNQEVDIAVTITPALGFTETTPFNVNAVCSDRYAGGVTLYVAKA
jgi:hypothetical protein